MNYDPQRAISRGSVKFKDFKLKQRDEEGGVYRRER